MKIMCVSFVLLFVAGCTSYEKISSGAIGCAPRNITVYDVDSGHEGTSWTAVCQNQIYYCFQASDDMGGKYSCTPSRSGFPSPSQGSPSPSQVTPANRDTEIAGSRVEPEYKRQQPNFFSMVISLFVLDRLFGLFGK